MENINLKKILTVLFGSFIQAFGIYNIHSISGKTEGGIYGIELLALYCLGISPAVTSAVLSSACYYFGVKTLGKPFVLYSVVSTVGYSVSYLILERFPVVLYQICPLPLPL